MVLIQMHSVLDKFETYVVLEESATLSDGC